MKTSNLKKFNKTLFLWLVTISIIVIIINCLYIRNNNNYGTMSDEKNDNSYITNVPNDIEICNIGNSHGYYAFNYKNYNNEYTCFNFSLPDQSLSYDYLILKNYKDNLKENSVVYIVVSYHSFYEADETKELDFASKNKRYYHFLDSNNIKKYDFKTDIIVNYIPSISVSSIKDLIKTIAGRNTIVNEWDLETNKEEAIENGNYKYNIGIKDYLVGGERILNEEELQALYNMVYLCKDVGARPIIITTPCLSEYTDEIIKNDLSFYDDFEEILDTIVSQTGVDVIRYDLDSRFNKNYSYFINVDHMNSKGALEFTNTLLSETFLFNK